MPFNYEAAARAMKSWFGFSDRSTSESVPTTPFLLSSAARWDEFTSGKPLLAASAARRIVEWEDDAVGETSGWATQSSELGDDSSFWKDNDVQVIIRMRPLSGSEISQQGLKTCVRRESPQVIAWTGPTESRYTFDLVADENVSQEQMFKVAGLPMVDNCMGGYNSCMFAYGQTGSGKTYTMLGDIEGGTGRHSVHCGMTPRVFEYLFSRIQKEEDVRKDEKLKFICKCSFLEIYNEQILDLLDPSSNNLQIREDVKKGVYVENLKEVEVTSARDVIQQLIEGAANRKVAATNMSHASSRSHSVFTCIIESKWESQGVTHHRFARLSLVDLAGSERQKSSGAEGEHLKEATNINKSLSTLGLVIMNLVSISNGKSLHVPYRDSKLTFLLQDSLGGNSKTIIVANISPALCNSLETLGTLKFAQRAKFIKNNAIVNEDTSGDVIGMRMQIQQLKKEVSYLRSLVNDGFGSFAGIEASAVSIAGSPGPSKWAGLQGSFSPFVSDKRVSQKPDYEIALVGAIRREKDKDMELKAVKAENQAVVQLAKQREDEIQGLEMRLLLRDAGFKRLKLLAIGKMSAETHLLRELKEQLKEIKLLRTQVDRNEEVPRFAMENLKLKEEIRRLKPYCEEGEMEIMNEQITVLQNEVLEALDWKLMHESETIFSQAIVNEDTSGDVIGMRMQIQQLKKEVSHLRSLVNDGFGSFAGVEASAVSIAGSPGAFKWEGLQGSFSPLLSDKGASQKPDYEIALIGAIRRGKDKDMELKALKAENQAVVQLAKQREDEMQGLKMRLRFCETGTKRLCLSRVRSRESFVKQLLEKRDIQLKKIKLLQTKVDRNQEVSIFAMENLKLKEEIRRLKSYCKEGEREIMNEQITVLLNKLLEAQDWKLLHEPETISQVLDKLPQLDISLASNRDWKDRAANNGGGRGGFFRGILGSHPLSVGVSSIVVGMVLLSNGDDAMPSIEKKKKPVRIPPRAPHLHSELLVQTHPRGYCTFHPCYDDMKRPGWVAHGLWPVGDDLEFEENCTSWDQLPYHSYFNISDPITSNRWKPHWKGLTYPSDQQARFWNREYIRHGSCSGRDQLAYGMRIATLMQAHNFGPMLRDRGIISGPCSKEDFRAAIRNGVKRLRDENAPTPVLTRCRVRPEGGLPVLTEAMMGFSTGLHPHPIDCTELLHHETCPDNFEILPHYP